MIYGQINELYYWKLISVALTWLTIYINLLKSRDLHPRYYFCYEDERWGILVILFTTFGFTCSKTLLNYLAFQSFNYKRTRWRLFQQRVMRTKFDTYVLITHNNLFKFFFIFFIILILTHFCKTFVLVEQSFWNLSTLIIWGTYSNTCF
jgi:hypothetical protein